MAMSDEADLLNGRRNSYDSSSPPSSPPGLVSPTLCGYSDQPKYNQAQHFQLSVSPVKGQQVEIYYWTNYSEGECLFFDFNMTN